MNTNYVIILFYDIPNKDKIENKRYIKFNKFIKSIGFIMLQESVYIKNVKSKEKYNLVTRELSIISPIGSNIRSILLTENIFNNMYLINGEQSFKEKIISKKTRILEL